MLFYFQHKFSHLFGFFELSLYQLLDSLLVDFSEERALLLRLLVLAAFILASIEALHFLLLLNSRKLSFVKLPDCEGLVVSPTESSGLVLDISKLGVLGKGPSAQKPSISAVRSSMSL